MITRAINKAFQHVKKKGWSKTFWAVDLHETVLKPNWIKGQITTEFYPNAKEALQLITNLDKVCTIMYTCSHPEEIEQYKEFFKEQGINFDYVNENPEVINEKYGCYDKKPYFNVLFEDKAGFDPIEDWPEVIKLVKNLYKKE